MVEILRRPTKITQPRLQGFTVDVSGVYPALRPFDRISLRWGGGREGGKGGRGEGEEGGTEVLGVLGFFCSLPLDITKNVIYNQRQK